MMVNSYYATPSDEPSASVASSRDDGVHTESRHPGNSVPRNWVFISKQY